MYVIFTIELFSKTSFYFMFAISAYWFVFFKLQYAVYLMLPPIDEFTFSKYYKHFYVR